MKTSPPRTVRAADGRKPIAGVSFHAAGNAVAESPAPRAAGNGGTVSARMSMSEAIATLADAAIRIALHARAELRRAARVIMITVQGVCRDCGEDPEETISLVTRIIVRVTSRLGGNAAASTTGLVQGAIDSASSEGISPETAAAAAADGALQAGNHEGWTAVASVRRDIHETAGLTRYAVSAGIIECSVQLTIVSDQT